MIVRTPLHNIITRRNFEHTNERKISNLEAETSLDVYALLKNCNNFMNYLWQEQFIELWLTTYFSG